MGTLGFLFSICTTAQSKYDPQVNEHLSVSFGITSIFLSHDFWMNLYLLRLGFNWLKSYVIVSSNYHSVERQG